MTIDYGSLFGMGPFYPRRDEAADAGLVSCPGAQPCPPFQEMTVATEPLEPVCTCTPEELAFFEGSEAMRNTIRAALERMFDNDDCKCYRCLRNMIDEAAL
jgi:hypothetical protein